MAKIDGGCEIKQVCEASTAARMAEQRPGTEWKEKSPKTVSLCCHQKNNQQMHNHDEILRKYRKSRALAGFSQALSFTTTSVVCC